MPCEPAYRHRESHRGSSGKNRGATTTMIRRSRCATAPASHSNPTVGTATGRRRYDNVRCGKTRVINAWFPPPHEATAPDLHSGKKSRDDGGGTEQMEAIELMRSMRAERNLAWPSKHTIARTEHGATRVGLRELRPSGGLTTPVPRSGHACDGQSIEPLALDVVERQRRATGLLIPRRPC